MHYLRLRQIANVRRTSKFKVEGVGFKKDEMIKLNLMDLPGRAVLLDFGRNIFCVDKMGTGLCFAEMDDHFVLYNFMGLFIHQGKLEEGGIDGNFSVGVEKYTKAMKRMPPDEKPGDEMRNMMVQGLMLTAGICKNMEHFKKRSSNYYGSKVYIFEPKLEVTHADK